MCTVKEKLLAANSNIPLMLPYNGENLDILLDLAGHHNALPVVLEMAEAGIRFTENTFLNIFVNQRRTGRTAARQLKIVRKVLSAKKGERLYIVALDHRWRWDCHCRLAELAEDMLNRFERIRCRRVCNLLIIDVLNDFPESGGNLAEP